MILQMTETPIVIAFPMLYGANRRLREDLSWKDWEELSIRELNDLIYTQRSKELGMLAYISRKFPYYAKEITLNGRVIKADNFFSAKRIYEQNLNDFDFDAFSTNRTLYGDEPYNVVTYAVVVLWRGVYYGHIYAWMSPTNKDYVFAIGIRSTVENWLLKGTDRGLDHVSAYLLEGVRQFALSNGARNVAIVDPRAVMIPILLNYGFRRMELDEAEIVWEYLGNAIILRWGSLYIKEDLSEPIMRGIPFTKI